jgi:hypothetical protein
VRGNLRSKRERQDGPENDLPHAYPQMRRDAPMIKVAMPALTCIARPYNQKNFCLGRVTHVAADEITLPCADINELG